MFNALMGNLPTILAGGVVAAVVGAVIVKLIRDKKRGKSSCGGGCAGCASSGMCHPKQ